jgi:uncharacterized tellurite resistance protein B-like protein
MSIGDLSNVLKIFGGSDISEEKRKELYQEVLLMVLARASSSDSNIDPREIEAIQEMVKTETGSDISVQDVRKAARTELYETTPVGKYLSSVRKKLADAERVRIIHLLADVIKSDASISVLEVDFFNMVANALQATPAEVMGISAA